MRDSIRELIRLASSVTHLLYLLCSGKVLTLKRPPTVNGWYAARTEQTVICVNLKQINTT